MHNAKERNGAVSDEQAMLDVMALLDGWEAPEPSPWFDSRIMARFQEEQERASAGWFGRLRDRLRFGNPIGYRPMLAGAMALVLLAGGGSYLEFMHLQQPALGGTSRTLQDLQVLDNNDQAIQQMDQLLDGQQDDSSTSGGSAL